MLYDKLSAINVMLSHISQAPINSLNDNKSSRVVMAENILNNEVKNTQLIGWFYNTEDNYPLYPNNSGEIDIPQNTLKIEVINDSNKFIQHGTKLYDKTAKTYNIGRYLECTIVKELDFEILPPHVQQYIVMAAANKFIAQQKQSKDAYAFTQAEVDEAKAIMYEAEADTGNYSILDVFDTSRRMF